MHLGDERCGEVGVRLDVECWMLEVDSSKVLKLYCRCVGRIEKSWKGFCI